MSNAMLPNFGAFLLEKCREMKYARVFVSADWRGPSYKSPAPASLPQPGTSTVGTVGRGLLIVKPQCDFSEHL